MGTALYFAKSKKKAEKWFSFAILVAFICSIVAISTIVFPYFHYLTATVAASFVPLMMYLSKLLHEDTKVNKYFSSFLTVIMIIGLVLMLLKSSGDNIENNSIVNVKIERVEGLNVYGRVV